MDEKIAGLSECKKRRKFRRQYSPLQDLEINNLQASDAIPFTTFSETPLEDLLAFAPQEPLRSTHDRSVALQNPTQHSFAALSQDPPVQEESILPSSMWHQPSEVEHNSLHPVLAGDELPTINEDERSVSSTYLSTSSLERRLPKYSTGYIKTIARLLNAYSISGSSAAITVSPAYARTTNTENRSTDGTRTIRPSSSVAISTRFRIPRLILPSAFLVLDRYIKRQGLCIPGMKAHDSKTCWCLEELDCNSQIWVDQTGLINQQVDGTPRDLTNLHMELLINQQVDDTPIDLTNLNMEFRDRFGNTVLHMLAARGADLLIITEALKEGVDGNAKNMAGQNFLHVLHRRLISKLASDWKTLLDFLLKLNRFNINFNDLDLFGRSFFHLLTHRARNLDEHSISVLEYLNVKLWPSRDAFGWVPTWNPKSQPEWDRSWTHITRDLRRVSYMESSPDSSALWIGCGSGSVHNRSSSINFLGVDEDESSIIFEHARLLETARIAMDVPFIEDSEGRNGLQCLAEASLTLNIDNSRTLRGKSNKRKRDQLSPDASSTRLNLRYQLVQHMVSLGVDINNYDKHGNTVIMTFVTHLKDGEDDKTLAILFGHLINKGANIHWRNRQGETALHIAVRLGRKIATRVLLENSANVHARTAEGKGVLALGETHYFAAREDPLLYASIMACMALCIRHGAVAAPTLVQEWSVRDGEFK